MNAFRATLEIARQTFLQLLRHRLFLLVVAVLVLAGLGAFAFAHDPPRRMSGESLYVVLAYWVLLLVLVPWVSMFFGVHAVSGDIEDRTFQFLFLRPVPRRLLLLGKWLGTVALASLLLGLGALPMYLGIALAPSGLQEGFDWRTPGWFALAASGAVAAYAAMAVLFAAWFRRPLVWGMFLIVGVQQFVAILPAKAGLRAISVNDALRRLLYQNLDPSPRLVRLLWPGELERIVEPEHLGHPWLDLLWICVACLAAALLIYGHRDYDSRQPE